MIVIYIENIIPTISTNDAFTTHLVNKLKAHIFHWKWETHHSQVMTLMDFQNQLVIFLNQYQKQEVCLIIDSFASFVFQSLQPHYPNIKRLIFINPILKNIRWKIINLKNIMLPTSTTSTLYKYMYLFKSLAPVRNNTLWLKNIQQEQSMIEKQDLLYHKLFDQILNRKLILSQHNWLKHQINGYFISGSHNPLTPSSLLLKTIDSDHIMIIEKSGFCIAWEQPNLYNDALIKSLR